MNLPLLYSADNSVLTPVSLTAAYHTQSVAYDALGRLSNVSNLGGYSYGDSAHVHAATNISSPSAYTAAYDTAGDMLCRAPTSATTCAGAQTGWTGQSLAYDNEERLTSWASAPSGSMSTASFLYDGAGQRVEQQSAPSGQSTTTTTYALGGLEEESGGTLTKYLAASPGCPARCAWGPPGRSATWPATRWAA